MRKKGTLIKPSEEINASKFKALIENAFDGIVLYDAHGIIQYASPSLKQFGGYSPHDLIGKRGTDFVYKDDVPAAREAFYKVLLLPGKSITHIQRFVNKSGKIQWSEYTLTNLLHNPDVRGVVSNFRDIHERKIAEEEANRVHQLLNMISDNVGDGIFFGIPGEEFQYVNKAFLEITGYKSIQELKKIKPHHLFADLDRWKELNARFEKNKSIKNEQARFRKKSGEIIWGSLSLTVFQDNTGRNCFVGAVQDITRHKKAEEEFKINQQLLRSISQNINEGLFRSNGKKFLFVNEAFVKMFGYGTIEEMLTINPKHLYVFLRDRNAILAQLKKSSTYSCECQYRRKDNSTFWGQVSYTVVKGGKGELLLDGSIRDITKQKAAEQQLTESRTFLDNVMKTVAAPIFVKDSSLRYHMFNDAFCWFMGKKRSELTGKTESEFFPEDHCKKSRKIDQLVLRTGDVMLNKESIKLRKDQTKHILTVKSRFINDNGEKFLIGFITDITEIKDREEEISKLNANLLGVMESTNESIYAVDTNLRYLAFNNNHAKMAKLIYGASISLGDSCIDFFKDTPEAKWFKTDISKALKGKQIINEKRIDQPRYRDKYILTTYNPIRNKKNKVTGVAVFVRDITEFKLAQQEINKSNATLHGVIESTKDRIFGVDTQFRYLMFNKSHMLTMKRLTGKFIKPGDNIIKLLPLEISGLAKRQLQKAFRDKPSIIEFDLLNQHLEASVNPIKDTKGSIIGATMFVRDITQRKNIEARLRHLNEELTTQNWRLAAQEEELRATLEELSERNFELDQLMYKTSHDLRSPLSSILGLVNLANLDKDLKNQKVYLDKIEGRIKKLDEFIRSMLNYARVNRSEVTYETVDLKTLTDNCIRDLEYLEGFNAVETNIDIGPKHLSFKSDPLLLKIIFSNIISNAYKYYNPAVNSYLNIIIKLTKSTANIVFKDNGIGIEEQLIPKVFDMFYRATEKSQGSGLGMYIVKQAVDRLSGSIEVNSTIGKGTTFKITLPNNGSR